MRDPSLPRRRFEVDWALVALLAAVAWGFVIGCSLTGCHRVEVPAHADSGAAPERLRDPITTVAPNWSEGECPGGMCDLPKPSAHVGERAKGRR